MIPKVTAFALFALTTAGVALYPAYQSIGAATPIDPQAVKPPSLAPTANTRPRVEVVFVLDTTGSMSGLIQAAKEKIWSIATTLAQAKGAPDIRIGLVAYRDRGDAYVTRVVDLSEDLDSMYATLMDFQADGGGDGPESVNQALYDAVHRVSWSQDAQTYKAVFLVGDAPPHMDYQDDVKYPQTLAAAANRGILVNTIQCGQAPGTTTQWQQIARLGKGDYFRVEQAGSAVAVTTPYDKRLADLSARLDDTRVYYGTAKERVAQKRKLDATEKLHAGASVESRARRATFNATASGAANFLGKGELVDDVASGRVDLPSVAPEKLPEPLRAMSPAEQEVFIATKKTQRKELKEEIRQLSEQRAAYVKRKLETSGEAEDSLDDRIYSTVREQAGKQGLVYEADAPAY